MSTFQFVKDTNAAMSAGAGGITTGVYKLIVKAVALAFDKSNNPRATFYFEDENGRRAVVFDMCIAPKWSTGSDNVQYATWQEFASIVGMETGATAQAEVQTSKTEKKTLTVFTECTGKVVQVALQEKFDIIEQGSKAGQESNTKEIYRTFYAEGHTLAEKTQNVASSVIESVKSSLKPYETKKYKAAKEAGTIGQANTQADAPVDNVENVNTGDLI